MRRGRGNPSTREKFVYRDIITAFDIETSRIPCTHRITYNPQHKEVHHWQTAMYIWQWQFDEYYTVIGRTWDEYRRFAQELESHIHGNERLVVFVHNLSYEFQFLRAVYDWHCEDVFCLKSRHVLRAFAPGRKLEFRCSYMHSNMSLGQYTHKMEVAHTKLSGDEFDYSQIRYPWTKLTDEQMEYAVNDVLGLVEAIKKEMSLDGDTLYTFPLTSTGYLRREVKRALKPLQGKLIKPMLPDMQTYKLLREAFAGGDTHANRYYAGQILHDVHSYDRSSSYPDVQCNDLFPSSKFEHLGPDMILGLDEYKNLAYKRGKAVVARCIFSGLKLKNETFGCPYFSRSKCRGIINGIFDNGRVLEAEALEITLTEIDMQIVLEEYKFDTVLFTDVMFASKAPLPKEFRKILIEYYEKKTALKDIEGQEIYYMKSKNKLNSGYGLTAQDIGKQSTIFMDGEFVFDEETDLETRIEKYQKKGFVPYQWGVYTTAHARYRLHEAIWMVGDDFVYCDTDSVKFVGNHDFTEYNKTRTEHSKVNGATAIDKHGKRYYMGVYEEERPYDVFRTWGAKKYAYIIEGKLSVTVSGVNKKKGGKELAENGGIEAFAPGFCFVAAGGSESEYNDQPPERELVIDGKRLEVGPNICIKDGTYILGITQEYGAIIERARILCYKE